MDYAHPLVAGKVWFLSGALTWHAWLSDPNTRWLYLFTFGSLSLLLAIGFIRRSRERERALLQDSLFQAAQASYFESRDLIQAKQRCEEILRINPANFGALQLSGIIAYEKRTFQDAQAFYLKALRQKIDHAPLYSNLGNTLQALERLDEALECYDKAILLKPDFSGAFNNRGNVLHKMRRIDEALASYAKAIDITPDFADAHYNRGQMLLLSGRLVEGWDETEWRKKSFANRRGDRSFPQPLYLGGETLSGKTILVHYEQGLGDTIQFCRYVPLLAAAGATVLFAPQKPLRRLLSSLSPVCRIVDVEDASLRFDCHCPLLSLPRAFKTGLETIPNQAPYLLAEPDRIARWRARIGEEGFKIGICWQGGTAGIDIGRSFPLRCFERLSRIPGVRLISLHKGKGETQLYELPEGMVVETFGEELDCGPDAFVDSAAVMKCCDLVITSDTSIAHLAVALVVKTWIAKTAPGIPLFAYSGNDIMAIGMAFSIKWQTP